MLKVSKSFFVSPFFFSYTLVLYELCNYLANDMYLPALPALAKYFSVSVSQAQYSVTVWFLGMSSLQLIIGPLSDQFGRKPMIICGCFLFIVSTIICIESEQFYFLLVGRYFQGCSICFVVTAGYSSIHEYFSHIQSIKILTRMSSVSVLAPALGPLAGSIILKLYGWHAIFIILLIWAFLASMILIVLMPETLSPDKQVKINKKKLISTYAEIFKNKLFLMNVVTGGVIFIGLITWFVEGPFLVNRNNLASLNFGYAQLLIFLSLILGAQFVKWKVHKINANKLCFIGLMISSIAGILSLLFSLVLFNPIYPLIFCMMIYTFGLGILFTPSQRLAIEANNNLPMGYVIASYTTLMGLFAVLGSLFVSYCLPNTTLSVASVLIVCALISIFSRKIVMPNLEYEASK